MLNISVKGNIATVTFDITKDLGPSKSGKTRLVATTGGNQVIPGTDVVMGLNAYRKAS
jgi:hypothetical protein